LAANKFGAADFNTHYLSLGGDNVDDDITGASIDGRLAVDKFFLDQFRFGINLTGRKKSRDLVNNSLTGGADYYSGTNAIKVSDLGGNVISHSFTLPNFMDKVGGNFPRSFLAFDVPSYLAQLQAYNGHARPDGGVYDYSKAAATWNPQQSYRVTEKTTASYVQGDFSGDKWSGDVGVRVVNTHTTSQAWEAKINSITQNGDFNYTADYAAPTSLTQNSEYTFALPSANFVWHVTNDFQARVSAAKTMARPSVEKLAPTSTTESVSWGEFTKVYGGNAQLKPYSAIQSDLSLEWYYAPKSIFNVAFFRKNIKNQITSSWETGQDIGVTGHLFNISRPINGDYAKVSGVEVGLQHFWDNGFGVRAQYTHNKATSVVGNEIRPLEGVAPATSSLGGSYEKGPWSLSLTADKTDGFVTAVNVLGAGYDERVKAITWLSSSISYTVNDRLQITFEGRNLLDAEEKYTIAGNPLLAQGYNRYGRAFTIGASLRF
jgi:TonB-dependent receptor